MPIKRLTQDAAFPKIGTLRKGGVKSANAPGRDLTYFRFDSPDAQAVADFEAAYSKEPKSINCYLPHVTPDENFQAWQEEYRAGGLVHRCDGETMTVHMVLGGKYSTEPKPCPYHTGEQKRTKKEPGCKPVGRLTLIVPELRRFAYVTSLTMSINDIMELTANLNAIYAMRGSLQGIPFVLSRVPEKISTLNDSGERSRREMWMLHIEADPAWVSLQLAGMRQNALAGPAPVRMLTDGRTVTQDGEIVEDDPGDFTLDDLEPLDYTAGQEDAAEDEVEDHPFKDAPPATPQPTVTEGNEQRRAFVEFAKWSGGMKGADKDAFRHFLATESQVGIPESFSDATPDQLANFADWLQDNNRAMAKYRSEFQRAKSAA